MFDSKTGRTVTEDHRRELHDSELCDRGKNHPESTVAGLRYIFILLRHVWPWSGFVTAGYIRGEKTQTNRNWKSFVY